MNASTLLALRTARDALEKAQRMNREALPKFNWAASFLNANAIQLLNETPTAVDNALDLVRSALKDHE